MAIHKDNLGFCRFIQIFVIERGAAMPCQFSETPEFE
jgi:hypothetical protein